MTIGVTILIPYLICFTLTLTVAAINEFLLTRKSKYKLCIFITSMLVVLIPSIMAGIRDYTIGTDTYSYVTYEYVLARSLNTDLLTVWDLDVTTERGFLLLAWFSSLVSFDPHIFLFLVALLINGLVYYGLYLLRETNSIFLGEFVYLFCSYNETFASLRQSIAMAFVLVSVAYLINNKTIKSCVIVIIAFLFHRTAVIGWTILLIYKYLYKNNNAIIINNIKLAYRYFKTVLIMIILCCVLFLFQPLTLSLIEIGLLNAKYLSYLSYSQQDSLGVLGYMAYIFIYGLMFLPITYNHKSFYIVCAWADILFYSLRVYVLWLSRVATYFFYMRILWLSSFKDSLINIFTSRKFGMHEAVLLVAMAGCVIYWLVFTIYANNNETYPYSCSWIF